MQPPYQNGNPRPDWINPSRAVPALLVICIGVVFLLNNLHIIAVHDLWQFWPLILVIAGAFKLADPGNPHGRVGGAILVGAGGLFLADNLGLLPINVWDFWPVLLIGLGVLMLIDRDFMGTAKWRANLNMGGVQQGQRKESAVFGGGRRVYSGDFTGGKVDAVFSGFEIDLRRATIPGDSAVLKIDAVFGGVEVFVPESWSVAARGDGVFGAFSDSTAQPNPTLYPNPKRLIVKGAAVFGGVDIKN